MMWMRQSPSTPSVSASASSSGPPPASQSSREATSASCSTRPSAPGEPPSLCPMVASPSQAAGTEHNSRSTTSRAKSRRCARREPTSATTLSPAWAESRSCSTTRRVIPSNCLNPLDSAEADMPGLEAFRKGLRDLGWVEGRDFDIEARFAEGKPERLPELAAQLVRNRVDVILAGSTPGALAAKQATSTIPIVMVTTGDPIEYQLYYAFAHFQAGRYTKAASAAHLAIQ